MKPDRKDIRRGRVSGFTLVEMLAVIAGLALLIALLVPVINSARKSSERAKCISNLRQIGSAMMIYTNENSGQLPPFSGWSHLIARLIEEPSVGGMFECPAAKFKYDSMSARTYGYNRHLDRATISSISNPSRIVAFADGHWSGTYFYAQVDSGIAVPTPVHDGKASVIYLDQHVDLVDEFHLDMFQK